MGFNLTRAATANNSTTPRRTPFFQKEKSSEEPFSRVCLGAVELFAVACYKTMWVDDAVCFQLSCLLVSIHSIH